MTRLKNYLLAGAVIGMLLGLPGVYVRLHAMMEDCHPTICHSLDPANHMDDAILWWWFECDKPHCASCGYGDD